jgi:hypothetical protein
MPEVAELRRTISKQAHVPEDSVLISAGDGDLVVRLGGFAAGASLSYAARRRRIVIKIVRDWAGPARPRPLVVFGWSDGIARVEAAVKAVLLSSLGVEPETVSVEVGKHSLVKVAATFVDPIPTKGTHSLEIRSLVETLVTGAGGRLRKQGLYLSIPGSKKACPTIAEIVRSVRISQPVSLNQLIEFFRMREFPELAHGVLNGQLDVARQRGLVTQMNGQLFAVTAKGIAANPSTKRRTSPDIERALALGRRKSYDYL